LWSVMAWFRCEVCGRRMPLSQVSVGGAKLSVCPYCSLALTSYAGGGVRRPRLEPDESVLERFKGKARGRKVGS